MQRRNQETDFQKLTEVRVTKDGDRDMDDVSRQTTVWAYRVGIHVLAWVSRESLANYV